MASRSAWTAPIIASINLPIAVEVSRPWLPDKAQNAKADLSGFEPRDDRQQVAYRPREPIDFGAN
jgi:hypothetical protein